MQIKPENLPSSLARGLQPAYLIAGQETLLVQEACDAVLAAAAQHGFAERSVLHVEPGFAWSQLLHEAASRSLFAERKVLDVRVPANKLDRQASEALREYLASPSPDNLLLLRTGRLEARQRSSVWFKALDRVGAVVLIWPISRRDLPGWLARRARTAKLELDSEALAHLADLVEGNLLAAVQEIEKLALAGLPQPIDAQRLAAAVGDASHFGAFELLDAVFAGDGIRVRRVLAALREEGVSLFAVLGAYCSQLRGIRDDRWMPPHRKRLIPSFKQRAGSPAQALAELSLIDQQGKGALRGDPWLSLERLLLRQCGLPLPPLDREARCLRP